MLRLPYRSLYRSIRVVSLIGLSLILLTGAGLAEDGGDWPDAIDYPPNPVYRQDPAIVEQAIRKRESDQQEAAAPKKKGFLMFGRKDKNPPPTEEQITRIGPRDPAPYPDPLLRIPMKLQTAEGTVLPGIYLVRQGANHGSTRELSLTQKNRVLHTFTVRQDAAAPDAGTSPITQDPKKPLAVRLETQTSPDLRTLTIILREGETRFSSDPIPTLIDQRPVISY